MPLYQETLGSYRTRVRRILRDANAQVFNNQGGADPNVEIDAWINEAIRWRDLWSGGSRAYRDRVALKVGFDQYSLTTLFPADTVLDIINLWIIVGQSRYKISERPIDEVTKIGRGLIGFTNIPVVWCRYGATTLFIATAPASASYTADFDVSVLSVQMADANTQDPLPFPYTEPVPYKAAALAREQGQRQYEEATRLEDQAREKLRDIEAARVGEMPTPIGRGR